MKGSRIGLLLIAGLVISFQNEAQTASAYQIKLLRFDENYATLADSAKTKYWLRLKNIPVRNGIRASVGFNFREMAEVVARYGDSGIQDSYWLTRIMAHADVQWHPNLRTFIQLGSGLVQGRKLPARPIDDDPLYVLNGFVEARFGNEAKHYIRAGRQEFFFGSGRLIAPREGPNVRNSFDGIRLHITKGNTAVDGIYSIPVENGRGLLDDKWWTGKSRLWGVYNVVRLQQLTVDGYYIGFSKEGAYYGINQVSAKENRHSAGVRLAGSLGKQGGYDAEGTYQFGKFGTKSISAFILDGKLSRQIRKSSSVFTAAAKISYASGDASSADGKLGTYNPLFPNLLYYQTAVGIFPSNWFNPQFSLNWNHKAFNCLISGDVFWRASAQDALYAPFGVVPLPQQNKKYLGYQLAAKADYLINTNWDVTLLVSRYYKSSFVAVNTDRRGIDLLINLLTNIKF